MKSEGRSTVACGWQHPVGAERYGCGSRDLGCLHDTNVAFHMIILLTAQVLDINGPSDIKLAILPDPFCQSDNRAHFQ